MIGRLPIGIAGLAILLLAQAASGSFAQAGAAAACYVAGLAAVAPVLGRVIDRSGPRIPLMVCALAFPTALSALVAAILGGAPAWLALPLAFCAGASFPPITVCMRTFLKQKLGEDTLLAAAYSLESVLIETIFIIGPMLVAFFVAFISPAAAVLFAAACGAAGAILFLRTPALRRWKIEPREPSSLFGPLAQSGFPPLLAVIFCYAAAFGLVEIGITAFAAEMGRPAFAGVILGLMSIGSVAGGLAYGSRSWRLPLARQFAAMLLLVGAGVAPLAAIGNASLFAAYSVFAGVAMAPALIMQSMLVAKTVPPRHSTEAFTWSATGLLSGIGLGFAVGGAMLERWPSPAVFATASVLALAASALATACLRRE